MALGTGNGGRGFFHCGLGNRQPVGLITRDRFIIPGMRKDRQTPEFREKNREYQNEWYHANKASALQTRRKRTDALNAQVREYKVARGCERCAEMHPACLEFHHPDPSTKDGDPGNMARQKGWSFARLKLELDALQVLCANCHRKEHARLRLESQP